jgi:SAM-dependent methyltransferase
MTDASDPSHAPFAAALREHFDTGWPQVLGGDELLRDTRSWWTTLSWLSDSQPNHVSFMTLLEFIEGPVLDVGAGAGRTSLPLQQHGIEVVAIDREQVCVEIMRKRGVEHALQADIFDFESERRFKTILFMDATFGLVGTRDRIGPLLDKLRGLLDPDGVVLVQDGMIGTTLREFEYRFVYRDLVGTPFRWLNFPLDVLRAEVAAHGWTLELRSTGPGHMYVAALRPSRRGNGGRNWYSEALRTWRTTDLGTMPFGVKLQLAILIVGMFSILGYLLAHRG